MIHIAIGTKAQFIKMLPIMMELKRRSIDFNYIDLGQHSLITEQLREEVGFGKPDVTLSGGRNISALAQGLRWLFTIISRGIRKNPLETIFSGRHGICLIHGDTVSTACALYLAKLAGLRVAHVEAGLRSFHFWEPFPEEIIRYIVMLYADILFAPSDYALKNLKTMGLEQKSIAIHGNTSIESLFYSLRKPVDGGSPAGEFALVTTHRIENIFSFERLAFIVKVIEQVSQKMKVIFVLHPPTLRQLAKFGLRTALEELKDVEVTTILSHAQFTQLIRSSQFVITDGGSIQEECYYMGKPCLLLRKYTERMEGIGQNVIVCGMDWNKVTYFLANYSRLNSKSINLELKPSTQIVNYLLELTN